MKRIRIPYPWLSSVAALFLVAWPYMAADEGMANSPGSVGIAGFILLLLLLAFDIHRYYNANKSYEEEMQQYQVRMNELFDSKRELGTRARTSSDHAEKLKLFISDKLLEYMEYDEKFLHFQNIASEVRHNGVISYDKVQTSLKRALENCALEDYESYQEAIDSMVYLWDLLDLSTTDNLSLHIANQVYDCEEYFFELLLNKTSIEDVPLPPTFSISKALKRALLPQVDDPQKLRLLSNSEKSDFYHDSLFQVDFSIDAEIVGNQNHMVLLIENLLNNALFYAGRKPFKNANSQVIVRLTQSEGKINLMVYNPGPEIKEADQDRIYQLGYTSRRIREHHGKGLGLYFVNEITRGFEGSINFQNIRNRICVLLLQVELSSGESLRYRVQIMEDNGKLMCELDKSEKFTKKLEWSFEARILSMEVNSELSSSPFSIIDFPAKGKIVHLDPEHGLLPSWMLTADNKTKKSRLELTPLDIRGVEFRASFPTANSRLESQELDS